MIEITDLLDMMRDEADVRLTCEGRWLVVSNGDDRWWFTVYYRPAHAKRNRVLYDGADFSRAMNNLVFERSMK